MKSKLLLALLAFAPILALSQTYQPYQNPHVQFFAGSAGPLSAGSPAAGYKLCTYAAGTTTPQATYSNNSGTLNTNPVVLDSSGYATIYLNGALSYKFTLLSAGTDSTCATGTQQWSQDNITTFTAGGLTLGGNLLFAVDNTYDIGASGSSRPRDFYLGRNFALNGNITWNTDNRFDIGALGTNRPRDFYLGRNLKLGGSFTSNLTFSTDNTLDIGAAGATRPRNFYLAGTFQIGADLTLVRSATKTLDVGTNGDSSGTINALIFTTGGARITSQMVGAGRNNAAIGFGVIPLSATCDTGFTSASVGQIDFGNCGSGNQSGQLNLQIIQLTATAFASLGTPSNGTLKYCSDCTIANPCAGGGTGALAKRLNGVWVCN